MQLHCLRIEKFSAGVAENRLTCTGEDARAYISKNSVKQEFPIAFCTQDGRVDDIIFNTLQADERLTHFFHSRFLRFRIAHYTALPDLFSTDFKLGLYQNNNLAAAALLWRLW